MNIRKFMSAVAIITLMTFMRTHQRVEAVKCSYTIKKNQVAIEKLLDQRRDLQYNIARLKAPTYIECMLEEHCIKMVMPEKWQLIEGTRVASAQKAPKASGFGQAIAGLFTLNSEAQATPTGERRKKKR